MSKKENKPDEVKKPEIIGDVEVSDPQVLRPKELPLVIKPTSGEWKNERQAEYAKTLNGYAYRNPEKWAVKKAILLARLEEIGKNPSKATLYLGNKGGLTYKNKLIQE